MSSFQITIDGRSVPVSPGQTVLSAARSIGIDIPTLCFLEKCGPLNSCLVCLVSINGKLVSACGTRVQPGMVVESETVAVHEARRTALELLFSDHVGDCLSPCHRLCPLRMNIPLMLRQIESGKLDEAIATVKEALPLPRILGRLCHHPCEQGCRRGTWDGAAAIRDLERWLADQDHNSPHPYLPKCKPASGKSVVIIGAGPTGLAAAHVLRRQGHSCTIADQHPEPGGSLRRQIAEKVLEPEILASEIRQFEQLGIQFKLGVKLGHDLTLEGLLRGFDAVLVAVGELSKEEGDRIGLEMSPTGLKAHADTFQTSRPAVFAAGRATRPINQLIRAVSEGAQAPECINLFLSGKTVQKPARPFSHVMGRLDPDELKLFLQGANTAGCVTPCDSCAGFNRNEAGIEASRCLHCDCRASGHCALQSYAQTYGADPGRFRQPRRTFEQQLQPGGVVFEPGKCILCGICVKLTELAQEPLGLTFIGRGFDVRIAAPFDYSIEQGLKEIAAECIEHCPTGALAWKDRL